MFEVVDQVKVFFVGCLRQERERLKEQANDLTIEHNWYLNDVRGDLKKFLDIEADVEHFEYPSTLIEKVR